MFFFKQIRPFKKIFRSYCKKFCFVGCSINIDIGAAFVNGFNIFDS